MPSFMLLPKSAQFDLKIAYYCCTIVLHEFLDCVYVEKDFFFFFAIDSSRKLLPPTKYNIQFVSQVNFYVLYMIRVERGIQLKFVKYVYMDLDLHQAKKKDTLFPLTSPKK